MSAAKQENEMGTKKYWLRDDNLMILQGLSMQCRTLEELADKIGVHPQTIKKWKAKCPEIKEAIELGRDQADAAIIASSFQKALNGDPVCLNNWWKYRLASKNTTESDEKKNPKEEMNEVLKNMIDLAEILKNPAPDRKIEDFEQ